MTIDSRPETKISLALQRYIPASKALKIGYINHAVEDHSGFYIGAAWKALSKNPSPRISAWHPLMKRIDNDLFQLYVMELILPDIHQLYEPKPHDIEHVANADSDYKNAPTASKLWVVFSQTIGVTFAANAANARPNTPRLDQETLQSLPFAIKTYLSQTNARDVELATFTYDLLQWKKKQLAANPNAQADEAIRRILAAFQNNSDTLTLSSLGITLLPDQLARLTHLQRLDLSYNNLSGSVALTQLPANLQWLYLDHNKLSVFVHMIRVRLQKTIRVFPQKMDYMAALVALVAVSVALYWHVIHGTHETQTIKT